MDCLRRKFNNKRILRKKRIFFINFNIIFNRPAVANIAPALDLIHSCPGDFTYFKFNGIIKIIY